jgi:ribonuclease Z
MSFQVQILGSGAAIPTLNRNPSAQYVNCNDRHILIDCGEGTQNQLRKFGVKFQKIKHILISHLHGDHYFGLMGLLSTMNLLGRDKDVNLYGPIELKEIIDIQLKASGHNYQFNVHFFPNDYNEKTLIFEDKLIEIWTFPLNHRIKTHGFIISEKKKDFSINGERFKSENISLKAVPFFRKGQNFNCDDTNRVYHFKDYTIPPLEPKSYAYCSDNAIIEGQEKYLLNVDVLYHEATFTMQHLERAKSTKHSTAEQAAILANKCKSKKLILGHFSSRYDSVENHLSEAKAIFNNTKLAEDGLIFKI